MEREAGGLGTPLPHFARAALPGAGLPVPPPDPIAAGTSRRTARIRPIILQSIHFMATLRFPGTTVLMLLALATWPTGLRAQEINPLQLDESRWVAIPDSVVVMIAGLAVDTAGITEDDGFRLVWMRERLRSTLTVAGLSYDTLFSRRKIDCGREEWGTLEVVAALQGAEVARRSQRLFMLEADFTRPDRAVLDLVCAASP